jgi:hypothetical protein
MAAGPDEDLVRERLQARGAAAHIIREGSPGLIARWRKFVDEVEQGYRFGLEDYRNDLDIRTLIWVAGLEGEVKPEDERLRRMLRAVDSPVWASDAPEPFWVNGIPANASGNLAEDLRSDGFGV